MKKRNTIQQSLVLDGVQKLKCHATAEQVFDAVKKDNPSVGRATVYRNLYKLADSGKIKRVEVPNGADRFDHRCDEHFHAKCVKCGKIFDLETSGDVDLNALVKDAHGFEVSDCVVFFRGLCAECAEKSDG